ncbi:MAG TPA: aminotransferase class I/II-fold pyridoxal phosphate-dependent enzyme, partial [Acidimicrobiales bacterium]|nr:aminotransferase class I/II-fold pyridoxal phosphate-dependent enzyme [Acidimicrobiales bacterium]
IVQSAEGDELRARLCGFVARIAPDPEHRSPIIPVVIGEEADSVAASSALQSQGLWVPAIRPPTVPVGTSRLRVTLSAAHTDEQVDRLVLALAGLVPKDVSADQTADPSRTSTEPNAIAS